MRLSELVEIKQDQCPKCISYTYTLPGNVDVRLCELLRVFGRELYPINAVSVFKVEEPDQFYVECILGTRYLKIWFVKTLGVDIERRIGILESCLASWCSDIFDSDILLRGDIN
jgi:hypothetical protein